MAMETRKERQVGFPLAEHVGVVADRVMGERPGQTGQHHMLTAHLLPQPASQLEILLDVIAVGR